MQHEKYLSVFEKRLEYLLDKIEKTQVKISYEERMVSLKYNNLINEADYIVTNLI